MTLVLAIPLLVISTLFYQHGRFQGGLLLTGTLAYFLYNYASMAFGAAYNALFLVYVALFSASLFALVLALTSFDVQEVPTHFTAGFPRRGVGVFLIVSGGILALIWLVLSIFPALIGNAVPAEVASYTTFVTGVVDEGIVAPALLVSGVLLLRCRPVGYLLASVLLVFTVTLGPNLIAGGVLQLATGVISIGQALAFSLPFAILTLIAVWLMVVLFRSVSKSATWRLPAMHQAQA